MQGVSDEDILGNDLFSSKVAPEQLYNVSDIRTLRQVLCNPALTYVKKNCIKYPSWGRGRKWDKILKSKGTKETVGTGPKGTETRDKRDTKFRDKRDNF